MTHVPLKKVVALIPCFNEAGGIASVINGFPVEEMKTRGFDLSIMVIDNASTDDTAAIAEKLGATVIRESQKGKGFAMRRGFSEVPSDTDYVIMLDGDDTYRPEEVLRLLELLDSGFATAVIGSRLGGRVERGSMTMTSRIGNWLFSHLVRYFYQINVTDVLSGYFGWTREALERLHPHLVSSGFAIEMEMVTKMARLGEEVYCVPITYAPRNGASNLHPVRDGVRILRMFVRNIFWWPYPIITPKIARVFATNRS